MTLGFTPPVPRVLVSVPLAGPTPSGGTDAPRLCQGRSHPTPALPGTRLPSAPARPLRQPSGGGLSPPHEQQRLTAILESSRRPRQATAPPAPCSTETTVSPRLRAQSFRSGSTPATRSTPIPVPRLTDRVGCQLAVPRFLASSRPTAAASARGVCRSRRQGMMGQVHGGDQDAHVGVLPDLVRLVYAPPAAYLGIEERDKSGVRVQCEVAAELTRGSPAGTPAS